jgi:hypothetical protein
MQHHGRTKLHLQPAPCFKKPRELGASRLFQVGFRLRPVFRPTCSSRFFTKTGLSSRLSSVFAASSASAATDFTSAGALAPSIVSFSCPFCKLHSKALKSNVQLLHCSSTLIELTIYQSVDKRSPGRKRLNIVNSRASTYPSLYKVRSIKSISTRCDGN